MLLLLVGDDEGAVRKRTQGDLNWFFVEAGHFSDVLDFHWQSKIGKGCKNLRLVVSELMDKITEDELQRIIIRRATTQEVQRIGESAAAATSELSGHPAQKQRLATCLCVQGNTLGLTGPGEQRIAP